MDANQQPVRLLDLINLTRSERGLSRATRADLRFGLNTPGEVYITNKQDGIIRRLVATAIEGDFNGDGTLDVDDINLLLAESANGTNNLVFDLDSDNAVNKSDVAVWARDLSNTWLGDANLVGEFNTGDLTTVFQAAKFETGEVANWSEGDWTGDLRFGTEDLVAAFQDAGFEQGPRTIFAVPEPGPATIIMGILLAATHWFRKRA